jgi:hypothetical protein
MEKIGRGRGRMRREYGETVTRGKNDTEMGGRGDGEIEK